jgi:peroxiredoxin
MSVSAVVRLQFVGRSVAGVVVGLGMFLGACGGESAPVSRGPLKAGDVAPDWRAVSMTGEAIGIRDGGGALVVNVWATWCIPCREEMPDLQALHDAFGERGVRVVGVSVDGPGAERDVVRFLDAHGISFPIVHDPEERVTRVFRTVGVPETFLLDADGVVVRRWIGPVRAGEVESALEGLARGSAQEGQL